jgi:hypothetical protein
MIGGAHLSSPSCNRPASPAHCAQSSSSSPRYLEPDGLHNRRFLFPTSSSTSPLPSYTRETPDCPESSAASRHCRQQVCRISVNTVLHSTSLWCQPPIWADAHLLDILICPCVLQNTMAVLAWTPVCLCKLRRAIPGAPDPANLARFAIVTASNPWISW